MRVSSALLSFSLLVGCTSGASEEEYLEAWSRSCQKLAATAQEVTGQALPQTRGLPREERLRIVADRLDQDADRFQAVADGLRKHQPPARFRTLHDLTLKVLDLNHSDLRETAQAARSNDTGRIRALSEVKDDRLKAAVADMSAEARRLSVTLPAKPD